jgi:hypothetical protein
MSIKYDAIRADAEIEQSTRLYRITSPSFVSKNFLLNGKGCILCDGRYHCIRDLTSYASDNVFLCIAEKLFHMSNMSLEKLKNNSPNEFFKVASKRCSLVVFKCNNVTDLVNINSDNACKQYNTNPSAITHPDTFYSQLQNISRRIRNNSKKGIISPSARHSKGLTVVFFGDHTASIEDIEFIFDIELSLVSEDMKTLASGGGGFNFRRDRINQNIGFFKFHQNQLSRNFALLNPRFSRPSGLIDFCRLRYRYINNLVPYPTCAIGDIGDNKIWESRIRRFRRGQPP